MFRHNFDNKLVTCMLFTENASFKPIWQFLKRISLHASQGDLYMVFAAPIHPCIVRAILSENFCLMTRSGTPTLTMGILPIERNYLDKIWESW